VTAPRLALVLGLAYAVLGVAGGFIGLSGLLNALHFALGLWGVLAWSGALGALAFARLAAVVFALLALAALTPLVAFEELRGWQFWLHLASAPIAAYFGFRSLTRGASKTSLERRRDVERRRSVAPIAHERRLMARRRSDGGSTFAA